MHLKLVAARKCGENMFYDECYSIKNIIIADIIVGWKMYACGCVVKISTSSSKIPHKILHQFTLIDKEYSKILYILHICIQYTPNDIGTHTIISRVSQMLLTITGFLVNFK